MNKVVVVVIGWVLSLRRLVLREEKSELKLDFKDIKSNNNNLKQGHEHKDGDESCQQALLSGKGIPDAFTN